MACFKYSLERESANDESATVIRVHVASGERIAMGSPVLDIETSKVVKEIQSPAAGILRHSLSAGDVVQFGTALFYVGACDGSKEEPATDPERQASVPVPHADKAEVIARVSRRARQLAEARSVDLSLFPGRFITVEHVQRFLNQQGPIEGPSHPRMADSFASVKAPAARRHQLASDIPLSPSKRREMQNLQAGAGQTMLSVVGRDLGSFRRAYANNPFFEERIIDVVAYEASRLLQGTKRLNASFNEDGSITLHPHINAGIAIDDGKGLMVYSLRSADQLSLPDLQGGILEGLEKYLAGQLSASDISSATYSITDLSALGIEYVLPLLPRGQAMIIGITRSARRGFSLYVGFDHRVTEGREVSHFLSNLCDRILSFGSGSATTQVECSVCAKSLQEEIHKFKRNGLLRVVNHEGLDVLVCHNCVAGW